MKALLVAFGVAGAAFAGSSLYLWVQLKAERDNAAQVQQTTRQLNARIAELEQSRSQLEQRMGGQQGAFVTGRLDQAHPTASTAQFAAVPLGPPKDPSGEKNPWVNGPRPDRSAAFQKMMKSEMKANNRHLYADVGSKLGLDKETTSKLIDLLTEQQVAGFGISRDFTDPEEMKRHWEQAQRENENAISDLIGADKVVSLQEYQQSIPARQEFEMLTRQLQGSDITLTADQSKKLLATYIEERGRVPTPQFVEGSDAADYARSIASWQDDYTRRISAEASQILNTEQLAAYNEVQQMQKEMRDQFQAIAASAPAGARIRRMGPGGPNVMYSNAPAIGLSTVIETAAPANETKKP